MSYEVTNADGVVIALYEDQTEAIKYALTVGGEVKEASEEVVSESVLTESSPVILTEVF